ncbi:MAG: carboxypeptidase-like regulatory domain-containing protein, partial [Bacteroidales bacterium]|nr:carboxypeptidase-like regulatory domain-containing protein [Bacteroidales bacterium]
MKKTSFIRGDFKSVLLIALLNLLCLSSYSNPINPDKDYERSDIYQASPIKGFVLDEQGLPLLGATVYIKGNTSTGVTTNLEGAFLISANPSDILVVSYIGMKTQEILVGNQTEITIMLKSDFTELSEVMVVAYGTAKRETFTGSASVVGADKLEDRPVASF